MANSITINNHTINFAHREEFFRQAERGEWEPLTFEVLDRFVTPGSHFIDVGSWVGIVGLYACCLGAQVNFIEPDPVAYKELEDNVKANENIDCPNVLLANIAISNINGQSTFNTQSSLGNSESSLVDRGGIKGRVWVKTSTLSNYFEKVPEINPDNISLIKVDIEGGELLFIEGALDFLWKHKPTIYIAFHPAWLKPDLESAIEYVWESLSPIYEFRQYYILKEGEHSYGDSYYIMSKEDFSDSLHGSEHTFVLIPRQ
jgi:FkbM family methyltransferase